MPKISEILNVLCGLESAYCQKRNSKSRILWLNKYLLSQLKWVDDFKDVDDELHQLYQKKKIMNIMICLRKN